jgi:hypothetical protein
MAGVSTGKRRSPSSSGPTVQSAIGLDSQRAADEQLLYSLGIKYICDLMVETKKKKYAETSAATQHVTGERVTDFTSSPPSLLYASPPVCAGSVCL